MHRDVRLDDHALRKELIFSNGKRLLDSVSITSNDVLRRRVVIGNLDTAALDARQQGADVGLAEPWKHRHRSRWTSVICCAASDHQAEGTNVDEMVIFAEAKTERQIASYTGLAEKLAIQMVRQEYADLDIFVRIKDRWIIGPIVDEQITTNDIRRMLNRFEASRPTRDQSFDHGGIARRLAGKHEDRSHGIHLVRWHR